MLTFLRFIPIERWPLLVLSLFAFHNETRTFVSPIVPLCAHGFVSVNIHTHLIPFLLWLISSIPFFSTEIIDTPERCFMAFALLCLFCSSVWHVMAGCAHHGSMEFCARVDYVGIGWFVFSSACRWSTAHFGDQAHQCKRGDSRLVWLPVPSGIRSIFLVPMCCYGVSWKCVSIHGLV